MKTETAKNYQVSNQLEDPPIPIHFWNDQQRS